MFYRLVFILLVMLGLHGCTKQEHSLLTIATNEWIGYTPLFLAASERELEPLGFKLFTTVSLAQASEVFSIGKADLVTTTQYEYKLLNRQSDVKPIILLDISNGGDMILSNRTIDELKSSTQVEVYLEKDSINTELFEQFIKNNALSKARFKLNDMDQSSISSLKYRDDLPILIVTYTPYNFALIEKGFRQIASTRDINDLIVVDSICARVSVLQTGQHQLTALKKLIDRNIVRIQKDPKQIYAKVKNFLGDITYSDFQESLQYIQWLNHPTEKLLEKIKPMGYTEESLIR